MIRFSDTGDKQLQIITPDFPGLSHQAPSGLLIIPSDLCLMWMSAEKYIRYLNYKSGLAAAIWHSGICLCFLSRTKVIQRTCFLLSIRHMTVSRACHIAVYFICPWRYRSVSFALGCSKSFWKVNTKVLRLAAKCWDFYHFPYPT